MSSLKKSEYYSAESPSTIVLDTTYLCNLQCKMCHQNSPDYIVPEEPHIPVSYVRKILPIAKKAKHIYLLGYGEPFMHPEMYSIIRMIKDECPESMVETTSNGVLFNESNAYKLIQSGLDLVSISMDGPNLERGHQKSENTYRNLRRLARIKKELGIENPQIVIGFILGKDNEDELLPIIEFAKEVDAVAITVDALRIISPQKDWDRYIIDNDPYKHKETVGPILEKAKKKAQEYGIRINSPYIGNF